MLPRGIIITPVYSQHQVSTIDPRYLRKCLLYWDMIDCPNDAMIRVSDPPKEHQLLKEEGIFQRTRGFFYTRESGKYLKTFCVDHPYVFWPMAQSYALKKHDNPNERWSIGQTSAKLLLPDPAISEYVFVDAEG